MSKTEIGITLPALGAVEPPGGGGLVERARRVEELGLESVWVPDLIMGDGTPSLEAVVMLTTAAAVTERIGLGFGVLVLPVRPTAWLAAQIMTLQHLSGGRILLGVGSGGFPGSPFWRAAGVSAGGRGARTDAALDALPGLLAGEPTALSDQPGRPALTLAPAVTSPPVLIAGNGDVAIRRAVRYGAGWFPSLISPKALAEGAATLRERAAEQGRPAPQITVGVHYVGDAGHGAFVRNLVKVHGRDPEEAVSITVSGGPRDVADRIAEYAAAGADRVVVALDRESWPAQCDLVADARAFLP
jgi:alkanesulfonate monooxygenase SsuD/methylene tetrahydromethanopterin reductase-like flavin-dependent oxidoreductase (luciferase family)